MTCHRDDVPWRGYEHGELLGDERRAVRPASVVARRGLGVVARAEPLNPRDGER